MEFEDLDELIEWEARRVAAAFGLGRWDAETEEIGDLFTCKRQEDFEIRCWINNQGHLRNLHIDDGKVPLTSYCDVEFHQTTYCVPCLDNPSYNELMARTLYRLGIEYDAVPSQLPQLSAHEKLELRLSMPREFWPKTWLDEEEQAASK